MGAREPRASPLRPRPPPSSPELGGRGGRGRPLRRQTPVELKDTAWGSGRAPRGRARGGFRASGGRQPGHAERPEGQVSRRRPGGGVRAKVPGSGERAGRAGIGGRLGLARGAQRPRTRRGWSIAPSGSRGTPAREGACARSDRPAGWHCASRGPKGPVRGRGAGGEAVGVVPGPESPRGPLQCQPVAPRPTPPTGREGSAEMSPAAIIRWCARSCGRR